MMNPVDAPLDEPVVDPSAWLDAHWEDAVKRLWPFAVRLAKSEATAEDLFQDVYVKLYTGARTIDPRKHPVNVVKSAVGSEFVNAVRRLRAKHELPADSRRDGRAPASTPSPDSQMSRIERRRARDAALDEAVGDDPIARALLASARGDASADPYALGDDKDVANAIRRLRYAIGVVDARERDEEMREEREP